MIKWIMMSLSAILFLQMSIFLISPKLFNKFADLFGEKTKINLKMNKLTYLIIGYFTSIYVFIKGFRLNGKESIDSYTIYVFIFIIFILAQVIFPLCKDFFTLQDLGKAYIPSIFPKKIREHSNHIYYALLFQKLNFNGLYLLS